MYVQRHLLLNVHDTIDNENAKTNSRRKMTTEENDKKKGRKEKGLLQWR
jgi:hypothetical protein